MRGVSRAALVSGREALDAQLAKRGAKPEVVGQELFAVAALLDSSAAVRRALTDPSAAAGNRAGLVHRLLDGKVGARAGEVVAHLAEQRWGATNDLTDAVETLAVESVLAAADAGDRLDAVEDELFRFSRTVAGDPRLRDAFSVRVVGGDRKSALVERLLAGKVAPETMILAAQAAVAPRGRRTEQALERYVEAAAARRRQFVAHVVVAVPLSDAQRDRLSAALERLYGRAPRLNVDVDPDVVGGLRVQVGGELIDGTMLGRVDAVRRKLAG
jgi:F-type H+-transporting ATPase subunit delta